MSQIGWWCYVYVQGYWCVGGVSGSVGEEDEDDYDYDNVETLKVRKGKGRRKERSKMKPLVLRPVRSTRDDAKRSKTSCRSLHNSTARLSRAQQVSKLDQISQLVGLRCIVIF